MKNSKLYNNLINGISNSVKQSLNEGSWGYEPLDSDSALDLRAEILDNVLDVVYDSCKRWTDKGGEHANSAYDVMGCIQYFLEHLHKGYTNKEAARFIKLYDECLAKCKADTNWINAWKKPEVMKYQLEEVQDTELFRIIREHSLDGDLFKG